MGGGTAKVAGLGGRVNIAFDRIKREKSLFRAFCDSPLNFSGDEHWIGSANPPLGCNDCGPGCNSCEPEAPERINQGGSGGDECEPLYFAADDTNVGLGPSRKIKPVQPFLFLVFCNGFCRVIISIIFFYEY